MSNGKQIPAIPSNEVIFLNEAMTNEEFRNALYNAKRDRKKISDELDRLGITFSDANAKEAALDAVENINWGDLHVLEDLLGRGGLTPRMG